MATVGKQIDTNLSKLEAQLHLWGTKLDEAMAKASGAGQQAKIDSRKQLEELKAKLATAREKLDEAKHAGSDKWDSFKEGVEHVWHEIEGTFEKLVH